jgi:drug/metabolite transporter (DMT)-like permease
MSSENVAVVNLRARGIALVLTGAVLWGISGTVAQFLFHQKGFSAEWLVVVRLLLSGTVLIALSYRNEKYRFLEIWKNKEDRISIVIFGILGMLAVQYTFFSSIKHGNAATATVLQYLAPVLITCYMAFKSKQLPKTREIFAVVLAFLGTFLLSTQGSLNSLAISGLALGWGLLSAVALAFYTLQPLKLLAKWGSTIVVGWAMLIGGVSFSFIHPPWEFVGEWTLSSYLGVIFVVLFGTIIAFYCYLECMRFISASEASLLACVEPLSAAVLAVIWLKVSFSLAEWIGTLCILTTIGILSMSKNKEA